MKSTKPENWRHKFAFIAEIVWLVIAIFALLSGIYDTLKRGISNSYPFYIITAVAFFMYSYRRYLRRIKKQ
ncbi:MAG: hypothetical protein HY738_05285 [Bacteroidia bacterium]|nr:hypothetical protein [Bacteroidia bacterium]